MSILSENRTNQPQWMLQIQRLYTFYHGLPCSHKFLKKAWT